MVDVQDLALLTQKRLAVEVEQSTHIDKLTFLLLYYLLKTLSSFKSIHPRDVTCMRGTFWILGFRTVN